MEMDITTVEAIGTIVWFIILGAALWYYGNLLEDT